MHPARVIPYRDLAAGLRAAVEKRLVHEKSSGDLRLYCYSQNCVYERAWDEITTLARGLVLDVRREVVVATPFPKFFNVGERDEPVPALSFDATEKLDGSLIIIWHDRAEDEWRCATKGSFFSDQARAAHAWLRGRDLSMLVPGNTYLCEWVAPDNRIVVPYERAELVLLGVYGSDGHEFSYPLVELVGEFLGWRVAERRHFDSVADLITHAGTLPATEEGFVLRFQNGLRLKVKGDEYRRIHALISRCTPLAMWEAMLAGDDMDAIRRQLPEEFWADFDGITTAIEVRVGMIMGATEAEAKKMAGWTDKEVGLHLPNIPEPARSFIFSYRKTSGNLQIGRARQALFRAVRPTGNVLEGYTPSYAMNRVMEEST